MEGSDEHDPPRHAVGLADRASEDGVADQGVTVLQPLEGQLTRYEQVLGVLTRAIVENELPPGSLHSAGSLAQKLNVSRTPVREALLQLEQRGMVSLQRGRGVRIQETSTPDLKEIFEMRLWLEPPATRLAIPNLKGHGVRELRRELELMLEAAEARQESKLWQHDRAFHLVILTAAGNARLAKYVDSLREVAQLRRAAFAALLSGEMVQVVRNHEPLLAAIEAGRAAEAEKAMYRHIRYSAELVVGYEACRH